MINAVIVDDEPLVRERIKTLLSRFADFQLVAECADGKVAIEEIQGLRPDVAFLDINVPLFNGFDIVANLQSPMPLIVFITAYDDFAIKAFEESAVDYLLKPIEPARFETTIERLRSRLSQASSNPVESLTDELTDASRLSRIAVRDGKFTRLLEVSDIAVFEADGNYVKVFSGTKVYRIRHALKSLESRLDSSMFLRIHRSAIANLSKVAKFEPFPNAEYILHFENGMKLTTSRGHARELRKILTNQ